MEEFGTDPKPKPAASVVVSGSKVSEADAFPKEAVKVRTITRLFEQTNTQLDLIGIPLFERNTHT